MTAPTFAHPHVPVLGRDFTVADLIWSMTNDVIDADGFPVEPLEQLDTASCWPCPGETRQHNGYGRVWFGGRMVQGHRLILAWSMGLESDLDLPVDLVVDHLCRVRECVNPRHLRLITNRENVLIGVGLTADQARRTHCSRGHELVGENLRPNKRGGRGQCRRCDRAHVAARNTLNRRAYVDLVPEADRLGIIAETQESIGELPGLSADDSASLARALAKAIIHARYGVVAEVA